MPANSLSRRGFLSAAACSLPLRAAAARPNVIVILVDDMGFSDIGCYGGEIPTPNLDRLAARGVRFTQFTNTARCSPTRAALMTGLYPHQAGMGHLDNVVWPGSRGYQGKLHDQSVTIAEALKPAGYFTAMTGKWHMGQQHGTGPAARGFDRSLNLGAGGIHFAAQTNRGESPLFLNGQPRKRTDPEFGGDWYGADFWTEQGLKFVEEPLKKEQPFFWYLAHCAPHFPLMAPEDETAKFRGKYKAGWDRLREERYARQVKMGLVDKRWKLTERPPDVPAWESLNAADRDRFDHMMAIYAAMVHRVDANVGKIVAALERHKALENTLILFLSDNGGNGESGPSGRYNGNPPGSADSNVFLGMNWATLNNTPFRRYKHFTHEGGIATPLIAHWPAGIPKSREGRWETQPGHVIDILPTVLDAAGVKHPGEIRGQKTIPPEGASLVPGFAGRKLARTEPIFYHHEGNRAVRAGKWKLVSKHLDPWELYDMEADRTETRNLAGERPEVVKDLSARYDRWAERTFTEPWKGPKRTDWGEETGGAGKKGEG